MNQLVKGKRVIDYFLSNGPDTPKDVVATCPTCHRQIHHGAEGAAINHAANERNQRVEAVIDEDRLRSAGGWVGSQTWRA